MKKAILIALGVALLAFVVGTHEADAAGTMHNCPQDGQWAISVWTGGETDAGEALATCGNIEVAYALTSSGKYLRYFTDAPEINSLKTLNKYDGVIALGGPAVPVAEPETNVSIYGELGGCTINDLGLSARAVGDSPYYAKSGLHMEPPPTIDGSSATWTVQNLAVIEEVCLHCNGLLQCADVPKASGDAHIYTVEVVVGMLTYEILPREHEYMTFYVGDGKYARLGSGGKLPPNPTCPPGKWARPADETLDLYCPGYPDAQWGAYRCGPDQEPLPGETYCFWDR